MSTLQPYIDAPYPNFALEEAALPPVVPPVVEVTPTAPARPVEAPEDRPDGDQPAEADAMELSASGRALADANETLQRSGRTLEQPLSAFDPAVEAGRIRNNVAVRELIQSLDNYDNAAAVSRYTANLGVANVYGASAVQADEGNVVANVRAQEDALYAALGVARPETVTDTRFRDDMMRAIDRWLSAIGVFLPGMLRYSSSDGFRFAQLSEQAETALRSANVMATYDRPRVAQYLRELAALTPMDFMFYDPTGLGDLALRERRLFLKRMDEILRQQRIGLRAAELRYRLDENGRLVAEGEQLDREEQDRLAAQEEVVNDYYAMLKDMVKQYNAGIVSQALG